MKNIFTVSSFILTLSITTFLMIPQNVNAQQNADPAKHILREFEQLEAQINTLMQSTVLGAPNLDAANRAIDEFMREHSAVKRILRTNSGGFTVNDLSADSPPAPSRSLANQRWLQALTVSRAPYYSSDTSSGGAVSLFYAWPLLTGPDRSHFSGAAAARIDLTTHIALIEDTAPFQLAHNGAAFFQHDWDEVDYNEEPLAIKGVENLTIRTVKPIVTRQAARRQADSAAASSSVSSAPQNIEAQPLPAAAAVDLSDNNKVKKSKSSSVLLKSIFQIFIILLILAIVIMVAVVVYKMKSRTTYIYDRPFFIEEDFDDEKNTAQNSNTPVYKPFQNIPSLKESVSENRSVGLPSNVSAGDSSKESISESLKEPSPVKVKSPHVADNVDDDLLPPQPIVEERVKAQESESDSRKNAKAQKNEDRRQAERDAALMKLLKSEFTKMENKIKALSDRIDKMEKR